MFKCGVVQLSLHIMASIIISLVAKWCGFVSYWLAAAALCGLPAELNQLLHKSSPFLHDIAHALVS